MPCKPELLKLEVAMRNCLQTQGQDVLQHGESVWEHFKALHNTLDVSRAPMGWKTPSWLNPSTMVELKKRLLPLEVLETYHRYHDCGKPACQTVDEEGIPHFPNHACVSAQVWRGLNGLEEVARLIEQDMDVHTLAAEDVEAFAARPEASSLMLTALAEIHSNAAMFGGIQSVSFKMKFKHLERRGRAVLRAWGVYEPSAPQSTTI